MSEVFPWVGHSPTEYRRLSDGARTPTGGLVTPPPAPTPTPSPSPTPTTGSRAKIGVYRGWQAPIARIKEYEAFLDRKMDYILVFLGTESASNLGFPNYMRDHYTPAYMDGRQMMLGASLSPVKANVAPDWDRRLQTWRELADGALASRWTSLATNMVALGLGESVLRGAHEFNDNYFPHRVLRGEEAAFIDAWQAWHDIIMAVPGAAFHFNWNPTTGDWGKNGIDCVNAFPGRAYVDTIDLDLYDRWYSRGATAAAPRTFSEQQAQWRKFETANWPTWRGLDFWRQFAVDRSLGMGFSEWGCGSYFNQSDGNHGGGDNEVFMHGMADFINNPKFPPGSPGGVLEHAFWEDGTAGIRPLSAEFPDGIRTDGTPLRRPPMPKSRAIFLEAFGGP